MKIFFFLPSGVCSVQLEPTVLSLHITSTQLHGQIVIHLASILDSLLSTQSLHVHEVLNSCCKNKHHSPYGPVMSSK